MPPRPSEPVAATAVGFIDMDCFYVAVERRRDPTLEGLPCAVVQYNARQAGGAPDLSAAANRRVRGGSGGIIAVSYEARRRGVTRQMSAAEARRQCPEVVLVQVPTAFGKADLSIYKEASNEVVALLASRSKACEKRSVDEVAVDVTAEAERMLRERSWEEDILPAAMKASHLADSDVSRTAAAVSRDDSRKGHAGQQVTEAPTRAWDAAPRWGAIERMLVAGAVVVAELRQAVASELGLSCSGGVAQTKLLAKMACGLHKPAQQTIVLPDMVESLFRDLPLDRLPGLGGDLGAQVKEALGVTTASELAAVPRKTLEGAFPKHAIFLLELAEGRFNEPVQDRELSQSLSSAKTFFGHCRLDSPAQCEHWLRELAGELHQRYVADASGHARAPTKVSVYVGVGGGRGPAAGPTISASRQGPLDLGRAGSVEQIFAAACACFRRWLSSSGGAQHALGVTSLGMSLGGMRPFEAAASLASLFEPKGPQESSAARNRHESVKSLPAMGAPSTALSGALGVAPSATSRVAASDTRVTKVAGSLARCFAASAAASAAASDIVLPRELRFPASASAVATASEAVTFKPSPWDCSVAELAATATQVVAVRSEALEKAVSCVVTIDSEDEGLDPAVLAELPADLRAEVLASHAASHAVSHAASQATGAPASKRRPALHGDAAAAKRSRRTSGGGSGSGITAFFRPAPGTKTAAAGA